MTEGKLKQIEEELEEKEQKKAALRRYEDARREHLGAAANLTFGLAAAGTGFCASMLTKETQTLSYPGNFFFVAAVVLFMLAVGLSMLIMWTRLQDFRLTAKKLRLELRNGDHQRIKETGARADLFGKLTWAFYRLQLASFGFAVLSLAVSLWLLFRNRIFP